MTESSRLTLPTIRKAHKKKGAAELAVLGGKPAFSHPLHVGRPNIGDSGALRRRLNAILARRWFTNDGPLVREFEAEVARICGVRHCIAMCNATVALETSIRALGLRGEVIVPSYTFVATAHSLQWQEITPVFCDMDPETYNLDPHKIEALITPRTSGIIGVHVWGRPCDTEAIQRLADRRGLKVIYDAAHAFGCSHGRKMIGNFGACEVFSFHATKFVNSFEGGAVVTNEDDLAAKLRLMRNFGFAGYDRVIYIGTNGKMTEICAAMGLTSLEAMDDLVALNRRNYEEYKAALRGSRGLSLIHYPMDEKANLHYIVVEVDPEAAPLNRDDLVSVLHAENVLARKYFWPGCHQMEPYRSLYPNSHLLLPVTERIAARIMVLPTGQSVTLGHISRISKIIAAAFERADEVRRSLAAASR